MRDEMRDVLNLLLRSFPSLDAWFAKQDATLGDTWSKVLASVDPDDAMVVVRRLIRGELDMPANYEYDRIAILIRKYSGLIAERRNNERENERRREERFSYHDQAATASTEFERFFPAFRELTRLGELRKNHNISQEENDTKAFAVKKWYRNGGDLPEGLEA